jgi:protein Hikeshi
MTGVEPFPEGFSGAVYLNYQSAGEPKWIYLGKVSNQKPSSIYKIAKLKHEQNYLGNNPFTFDSSSSKNVTSTITNALIGISVEMNNVIDQLQPSTEAQVTNISSFVEFSTKMLQNFYNYVSSFSLVVPVDGQQYVPLNTLQNWYTTFERRLTQNPNFWKNL